MWERVEGPSLNKKGGLRFMLSYTWGQVSYHVTLAWSKLTLQKPEEGRARRPKRPTFIIFIPVSD